MKAELVGVVFNGLTVRAAVFHGDDRSLGSCHGGFHADGGGADGAYIVRQVQMHFAEDDRPDL